MTNDAHDPHDAPDANDRRDPRDLARDEGTGCGTQAAAQVPDARGRASRHAQQASAPVGAPPAAPAAPALEPTAASTSLREYARSVRKRWLAIALCAVVGLAAAAALSAVAAPVYTATTKLYVSVHAAGTASPGELAQGTQFAQDSVRSFVAVATGDVVLDRVIDELGLAVTSEELAKHVTATNPVNTVVIEIAVDDPDPALAASIANAVARHLTAVIVEQLEAPAGEQASPVRLEPFQTAVQPESPTTPNWPINLAIGLLLGLAAGLAYAGIREATDTRVRSSHDVEAIAGRAVVGHIPFDAHAKKRPLVVHIHSRGPRAEAFRSLRTNVRFLCADQDRRSILITSALENEGKSTTAANLAIALADEGARVLLVDADLRRPSVADYMGIEGSVGLSDLLIGRAELDDVVQRWGRRKLSVLPAGRVPPNPSELLGSRAMRRLHDELVRDYEFVIFDAPPVIPVTDAVVLSAATHGTLLVVASGRTARPAVASASRRLEAVGAPLLGAVLTMVPVRDDTAYGSTYSKYQMGDAYQTGGPDAAVTDAADVAFAPRPTSASGSLGTGGASGSGVSNRDARAIGGANEAAQTDESGETDRDGDAEPSTASGTPAAAGAARGAAPNDRAGNDE